MEQRISQSARQQRLKLIRLIQKARESHLVAYVVGDRQGVAGRIGEDAVRPMYEHIRTLSFNGVPRIDLFLYSRGGGIEVPWRIVSMLRECCNELNVLVPYKAHSAATLVALGADQIVMGKKGELGPIDPILSRIEKEEKTVVQEELSVEDVMSYLAFIKERAGLSDQTALANSIGILAEKLTPWRLGSIYRAHSHIRMIARKLLTSRQKSPDEQKLALIIDSLAEKMYFHGHAIGRKEAEEIGLPISRPDRELEEKMWQLLEAYEHMMKLDRPVDPRTAIPDEQDEHSEPVILACIESDKRLDVFRGNLKFRHVRQMPPQLNLNINLNLQLPPGINPDQMPQAAQAVMQQMLQQMRAQIAGLVQSEIKKQAPIQRTEGGLLDAFWQEATKEQI